MSIPARPCLRRQYATQSRHALWYSQSLPPMIPIFLLGSAIYLGLQLAQLKLAHEKFMHDSASQIRELEDEVARLRESRSAEAPPPSPPSFKKRSWRWWM